MTRRKLKKLILEEFDILLEQEEDPFGGEEEPADEEPADEEPADEEPADEEGGDDEGGGEEEEETVSAEEEKVLVKTADDQIQHMLVDFESEAIKSAQLQKQQEAWYRRPLSHLIFEQEEASPDELPSSEIDLERFASDVARLIMNYDSLLDMEALIIDKAKTFLEDKYDEVTATDFEAILEDQFQIALEPYEDEIETEAPLAVGAGGGEGA
tara:strand:+ start:148 stop:783 length:636 start_codon:yes stop_codon:yes gene_type:complete